MFTEMSTLPGPAVSGLPGRGGDRPGKCQKTPARRARTSLFRTVAVGLPVGRTLEHPSARINANIVELSRWLPTADLALVRWAQSRPVTGLAMLVHEPDWTLRRRLRRLLSRILSPAYRHVASQLEAMPFPPEWPPRPRPPSSILPRPTALAFHLTIARAVFIAGDSQRSVAKICNLPLHVVRRHCDLVLLEMKTKS